MTKNALTTTTAEGMSRVDCHVHTFFSGTTGLGPMRFPESVTSPEQQVDEARRNGMSVICITDHNETKGGFRAQRYAKQFDDIEVVVGDEVMTSDGEVIGLWLTETPKKEMTVEETIDEIRSQGGMTIAPHPFSFYVRCLKDKIYDLDLDAIEIINGGHPDEWTNSTAQKVWEEHPGRWAQTGASDAHSIITAGYTWTEFPGSTADDFRKALSDKTTVACGVPAPPITQTQWSTEVVMRGQKMILQHWRGTLEMDLENPLVRKTMNLTLKKKLLALVGGAIYCCPPVPLIATWLSTAYLKKNAKNMKEDKPLVKPLNQ